MTYWLGKKVVNISNIAMANILLKETVVDELIQKDVNRKNIHDKCAALLSDNGKCDSLRQKLGELKNKLGGPGASQKAAASIYALLNEA